MTTRKDVAQRAGVSVATVSFVMNHTKNVTPDVHRRVMQAVKDLNYRPNLVARGLATRETRHVAMLVDNLDNPHYCEMLSGAQAVASENGYIVSVISLETAHESDILDLTSRGVDGVILALGDATTSIAKKIGASMPTVWSGLYVFTDYRPAVLEMVKDLRSKGHRRVAFLSGLPISSPDHQRYLAWLNAMNDQEMTIDEDLVVDGLPATVTNEAEGYRAMETLFKRRASFTAVFAINDLMAVGAMRSIWEHRLRIPDDVSIVGCDFLHAFQYLHPRLASMDVHAFETGRWLMQSLMGQISHQEQSVHTVTAQYMPQESVGVAPKNTLEH